MTIQHGSSVTLLKAWHADPHDPMFTPQRVLSRSLTNKYVLIRDIASASLREGHTTSRLSIKTHTGRSYKFLWLDVDPAFGYLKARLEAEIGSRLQLR
jgi:hypothetical protein